MNKQNIPAEPRPLPDGPLYFVGVGGAGMSAIAYVLAQRTDTSGTKRQIRGSDPGISPATRARLESVGVTVYTDHDPSQVTAGGTLPSALIVTDAVNEQNPEVKAAREKGIPIFRRPEALGAIVNAGRGIAIAGTHGKTTTTGMVASILLHAGMEPTVLIGGDLPMIGGNARNGNPGAPGGDIVLAEACEAYDGFLYLHPEIAVITNIEADHLDYHGTEEAVFASFARFMRQVTGTKYPGIRRYRTPQVILCAEDANAYRLSREWETNELLHWSGDENLKPRPAVVRYGSDPSEAGTLKSWVAMNIRSDAGGTCFDLWWDTEQVGEVRLRVPGVHNVLNALAAVAVADALGITAEQFIAGLETFTGTGRRFEKLGEAGGVLIVDDYAHHPTEIRATLTAARSAYSDRRIIAVFQPHLPSRTRDFMDDFAAALSQQAGTANLVVLTDIYLAREQPIPGVSSQTLAQKIQALSPEREVRYVPDKNELPAYLADIVQPGDLVLTMGAGDIRKAGEGLLKVRRDGK